MKLFLLSILAVFLALTTGIQAQWTDVSPVPATTYSDVACFNGNVFTAQSGIGIYHSTDNGNTWTAINNGLTDLNITSLLAIDGYLFAGSNGGKVFVSTNYGVSWVAAGTLGSNTSQVKTIVSAGGYIFAGTFSNGVFRSSDNGSTWDSTSYPPDHQVRGIAISGDNIFAGAYEGGVSVSTDFGTTWTLANNGLTNLNVTGIAAAGNTVYVGTNGSPSVFISTNNGTNWSAVSGSAHFTGWGPYVQSVTTFGEKNVFAGTFLGGVYLSTDKGSNWTPIYDGFVGNPLVGTMAISGTESIFIVETALGAPYNSPGGIWRRSLREVITFPPVAPALVNPIDAAADLETSLTLTWNSAISATGYQCQVSIDPSFNTNIVVNDSALTDTSNIISGLGNSTTYYWRVRAYNTGGFSEYSAVNSFTTKMKVPDLPSILAPVSDAANRPWNDTLICSKATGAAQYHWQVAEDINFTIMAEEDTTVKTSIVVSLESGKKYYWRVEAINPGGSSGYAGPDSFTVMRAPLTSPAIISPANNSTFQRADTLTFVWSAATEATGYEIQVSENEDFSTHFSNDSTTGTSHVITGLKNLQKYYWRVRGFNAGGYGPFASSASFTTIISVPDVPVTVTPTFRAINVPLKPVFEWKNSARAEKYQIQIATASNVYASGDSAGAFLAANVVFDTTLTDTTLELSFELAPSTKYFWHVRGIDTAGAGEYSNNPLYTFTTTTATGVKELNGIPEEFALYSNYPNPFNPSTTIKYSLPKSERVSLKVFNMLGQEVATLVNMQQDAGYYTVNFNAGMLSSGVYFYVLKTNSFDSTHKMLLLK